MNLPKLNCKINLKSKKFWIVAIISFLIVVFLISSFSNKKASQYETAKIERGDLVQTVDATGTLGSTNDLALYFVSSGIIQDIRVNEGDEVTKGEWLANLSLSQLNASVSQAQASLDQKLAGATTEQINVSQKQVESAQVAWEQAQKTLADTIALANGNLSAKYASAQNSLDDAYIKMYNAYSAVDTIKRTYFMAGDQESYSVAYEQNQINISKEASKVLIDAARQSGSVSDVDAAISSTIFSLNRILNALTVIRTACDSTGGYSTKVTAADKTILDNQKSYISTAQTAISQLQNDISILKIQNTNNINTAQTGVDSAKANFDLQQANYESLIAKPRNVDIAYYQAALNQAIALRNNAIIYAPVEGKVIKVNKKVGELISSSEPMLNMISSSYQIEIDVPETDVIKINNNDEATITFDAIGSDVKFKGTILSIDPASTDIQDVVYYKVKVGIDEPTEALKPGMTADVLIKTDSRENVIFVPSQAILTKTDTGEKYVRVLTDDKKIEEKTVKIGLKADDGKTEILEGLSVGETIVIRTGK